MAITCPIKSLKTWKDLVKVQGEELSYTLWNEYDGFVPEEYYRTQDVVQLGENKELDKLVEDLNIDLSSKKPSVILYNTLRKYIPSKMKVKVGFGRQGSYNSVYNELQIGIVGDSQETTHTLKTINHELLHSLTNTLITKYEIDIGVDNISKDTKEFLKDISLSNSQISAIKDLIEIYKYITNNVDFNIPKIDDLGRFGSATYFKKGIDQDLEGIHELVSEVFSNPELINVLKNEKGILNKRSNIFRDFLKMVLELFGVSNNKTLLEDIYATVEELLEINKPLQPTTLESQQPVKEGVTEVSQTIPEKKFNQEDPLIRDKYFKDSNTTTSTDILTKISESNHPLNRLAEHLIKYAEVNNAQIELVPTDNLSKEKGRKVAGIYIINKNKIEIAEYSQFRGLNSEPTILHEILHSLLYNKLNEDNTAQRDLNKLFEYAKQQSTLNHYGLKNIHEFVSELFTNSAFVEELVNIPPSKEVDVYKNFLSEILDYILGLFNINVNDNLYSQSFAVVTNLLEEVKNQSLTSEQISEVNNLYETGELLYSESKQNRPVQPSKAIVNNAVIPKPNIKTIRNEYVKPAVTTKGNLSNYISEINSPNKKYIASKYFRYINWGRDTMPYYPYSYGNALSNQLYVNRINSEFTTPVVFYDVLTKTIQFTDNVDKAISVEEVQVLAEERSNKEIQEMEKRMSEIEEDIVGQEDVGEVLFLEINQEEKEAKEKREQEKSSAQKTIERKEQLIRLFNKNISEGSPRRAELKARISLLEDQIAKLQAKESDAMVMETAREDIKEIDQKLNSIHANLERVELLDEHQLWNIISDLNEVAAYINGWHNISEYILDNRMFPEIRDEIRKLAGTFNDLNRFRKDLQGIALLNHSNKTSFKKFYQEDLLKRITDESKLSRWTLGAKHSPSEYVRIINDHFNKAAYNINKESYEKRRELDLWFEKLKSHTGLSSEKEISKIFLQYYSDGKWTGNYIGRIRQEYFDEKHKLLAQARETGKKEDWKKYYDFLKANSTQMTKAIYEKGSHPDFTKEDFDRQKRLLELYEEHKSKFVQGLIDSGRFEEGSEPFIQAISEWILLNSPWETTHAGNKGWEYRVHEKPNSARWKDPNFTKIEKDPVLMGFYEFLRKRFYENNKELPHLNNYQSNYLPEMRKTSMEVFTENKGMATAMSLLRDEFIKVVNEAADSEIDSRIVIGETTYKSIPIGMMGDQLTPEEKSQNIFQVVKAHTLMSLNYKYKSEVEPLAKAAMDLLEETEAIEEVNVGGKTIPRKTVYGDIKTKTPINTVERLQYLIDATLYDERKATEYKGKKEKTLSTGQKVVFSQAKAIDSLIKFTYVKALSIPNFMTPTVNLVLGVSQNYMYAAAGRNIDSKSLNWAYTKMAQTMKKSWAEKLNLKDAETVISWMRHLNILDDINESAYGDVQSWDRWLTILQSKGEYFNQGAVMMAFLKKNTVKDKDGNDVSIIDAFKIVDGTPVWDVDKMGEMTEPLSREIISSDGRGINMFRLRQKIKGINHYIHGDYASVLEGKKTSLGRSLMLFKTWLFQTWIHRFGKEDYDPDLQETVKGRYRSYLKSSTLDGLELNYKQVMKTMLKGFFSRKAFDNLSEIDKDNLIRNLREIQITVALSAAVALLMAAGADDDDEFTKRSLNLAINMLSRTQSDIMFYVDPNSARSVLNNIIAPVNTLNDLITLASAMGKTIQGDFVYKTGPWKDQNRILVSAARTLPIANGGVKMFNLATQVYLY